MTGLTETQRVAAGMLGRGKTRTHVAEVLGPSVRTIARWRNVAAFVAEEERARQSSERPDARGTLIDALSARRDDGVDWQARLAGAKALLANGAELLDDEDTTGLPPAGPTIHVLEAIPR